MWHVDSLVRPLVMFYLAMQLLLAMPAGAAAPVAGQQTPCEQMAGAATHDHCPCCPDGVATMKDCLAACTLAAAMAVSLPQISVAPARVSAATTSVLATPESAEPPLKPPPIA